MKATNGASSYGWFSIALHWLMAPVMFALGVWMRTLGYTNRWYETAPDICRSKAFA